MAGISAAAAETAAIKAGIHMWARITQRLFRLLLSLFLHFIGAFFGTARCFVHAFLGALRHTFARVFRSPTAGFPSFFHVPAGLFHLVLRTFLRKHRNPAK